MSGAIRDSSLCIAAEVRGRATWSFRGIPPADQRTPHPDPLPIGWGEERPAAVHWHYSASVWSLDSPPVGGCICENTSSGANLFGNSEPKGAADIRILYLRIR